MMKNKVSTSNKLEKNVKEMVELFDSTVLEKYGFKISNLSPKKQKNFKKQIKTFLMKLEKKNIRKPDVRKSYTTKAELVARISKGAGLSKVAAESALNAFVDTVKKALKKGDPVSLVGFGTFSTARRKARKGRNLQTGRAIKIPAARVPKFRAGKGLKDAVRR
jgi:DNA-binding protein HU-beta